ncbi:MAG: dienelactone hydrolase family protein [Acidimicrobiales bacterium]
MHGRHVRDEVARVRSLRPGRRLLRHGPCSRSLTGGGQGNAIDVVARQERGDLRLLAIFGTDDSWCPVGQIDELEAAGAEVVRYEGAGHGWAHDASRDNYLPADAADAWARAEAFLA